MKRRSPSPLSPLLVAAAAFLVLPPQARADASPADASSPAASNNSPPREVHPLIGALLTGNIDTSDETLTNPDNSTATGNLGGRYEVFAGAEFPVTQGGLRIRLNAGLHEGRLSAAAGNESFRYYPLEASLVYAANDSWRIGAGLRYTARLRFRGPGGNTSDGLGSTPSAVAFAEYALLPHVWLDLRFAEEQFEPASGGSFSTNHWGLGAIAEY